MWSLFQRNARQAKFNRRTPPSVRPRLEALEDRCLMSSGVLDPTFGSGGIVTTSLSSGNDFISGVLLQTNGDIIAYGGGSGRSSGGFELARYTPSGSLDPTFGKGGIVLTKESDGIQAAALQPDGKIVAAGTNHLIRYNSNGSLDTTFGSKGIVTLPSSFSGSSVLIQPDTGDIVVGGGPTSNVGGSPFELLRYTPNGKLDSSFGNNGEVVTYFPGMYAAVLENNCLALENGDIVAAGFVSNGTNGPGSHLWALARYTPSGSLDASFGSGGLVTTSVGLGVYVTDVTSLLVQPDGSIVAVGNAANSTNTYEEWALARYGTSGNLDSTFGSGGIVTSHFTTFGDMSYGSALQANGQIVVTGQSQSSSSTPVHFEIGRYNADGTVDTSFGAGGLVNASYGSGAYGVAIQTDGKIVTAGSTQTSSGKYDFLLTRYLPSEPQIGSFTANPNPVASGSSTTLTASNIADGNSGAAITQVAIYVDSNNDGMLEPGSDQLLGYATQTSPGVWTFNFTVNLAAGTYTLFAQAEDSDGVFGDPDALTLTVQ